MRRRERRAVRGGRSLAALAQRLHEGRVPLGRSKEILLALRPERERKRMLEREAPRLERQVESIRHRKLVAADLVEGAEHGLFAGLHLDRDRLCPDCAVGARPPVEPRDLERRELDRPRAHGPHAPGEPLGGRKRLRLERGGV